jgi:hypothetical protein
MTPVASLLAARVLQVLDAATVSRPVHGPELPRVQTIGWVGRLVLSERGVEASCLECCGFAKHTDHAFEFQTFVENEFFCMIE